MSKQPELVLQEVWGYPSFRKLQLPIIESVLEGNDTLALLPTGGGKSICYQVPALSKGKLALVISPLIALMQDQVDQLKKRNVRAVALHSGQSRAEIQRHLENATRGAYDFLYLSPERLKTDLFLGHLPHLDLSLVAIDEAHCISQWGHDFRPPYREIADIRPYIPHVPFIAVTATATPQVVEDIQTQLVMDQPELFTDSFRRENLRWVVINDPFDRDRLSQIIGQIKGSVIIYTNSRLRTADVASFLQKRGYSALHYHAGLKAEVRALRQHQWMSGKSRIMVATNAFGMGVDKPDVRAVIHMDIPFGPEEYYQEAGRAGRDGETSYAILIADQNKIKETQERLALQFPSPEFCADVYHALGGYFKVPYGSGELASFPFSLKEFAKAHEWDAFEVYYALKQIEKSEWIKMEDDLNTASKVFIKITKDQLYEMQVRNRQLDLFMKTILRMYEGIFIDFVKVDETKIAAKLEIDEKQVNTYLKRLQELEVLEYSPSMKGGAIIFLRERVQKQRFFLDKKAYSNSMKRSEDRWKAMLSYLNATDCRTNHLLAYFGEKPETPCGQCDICLGSREESFSSNEKKQMEERLRHLIENETLSPREIAYRFSYNLEQKVLNLLEELEQEGKILVGNDKKISWHK